MRETSVTTKWTCDMCGEVATTPHEEGLPDGWRKLLVTSLMRDFDYIHHVCGKNEPSCFRRLLIKLANEDKRK